MSSFDWLPATIQERSTVRELEPGKSLFRQGDKTFAIFEVEQGRLRLIRHTIDNHPVVLHTAKKGDLFAEAALFASAYQCDAIAAVASRVRIYPKRSILAAFRNDPALGEQFMAVLANSNSCAARAPRRTKHPLRPQASLASSRPRCRPRRSNDIPRRHPNGPRVGDRSHARSALPYPRRPRKGRCRLANSLPDRPSEDKERMIQII